MNDIAHDYEVFGRKRLMSCSFEMRIGNFIECWTLLPNQLRIEHIYISISFFESEIREENKWPVYLVRPLFAIKTMNKYRIIYYRSKWAKIMGAGMR